MKKTVTFIKATIIVLIFLVASILVFTSFYSSKNKSVYKSKAASANSVDLAFTGASQAALASGTAYPLVIRINRTASTPKVANARIEIEFPSTIFNATATIAYQSPFVRSQLAGDGVTGTNKIVVFADAERDTSGNIADQASSAILATVQLTVKNGVVNGTNGLFKFTHAEITADSGATLTVDAHDGLVIIAGEGGATSSSSSSSVANHSSSSSSSSQVASSSSSSAPGSSSSSRASSSSSSSVTSSSSSSSARSSSSSSSSVANSSSSSSSAQSGACSRCSKLYDNMWTQWTATDCLVDPSAATTIIRTYNGDCQAPPATKKANTCQRCSKTTTGEYVWWDLETGKTCDNDPTAAATIYRAPKADCLSTTPIPGPSNTPLATVRIALKVRFQGIVVYPEDTTLQRVKVSLVKEGDEIGGFHWAEMLPGYDGTYKGTIGIDSVDYNAKYYIFVKGPKHLQKKFCDSLPRLNSQGFYNCSKANISLHQGQNDFDFSNIKLLAGDLPQQGTVQNGIIDAYDLAFIRSSIANGQYSYECDFNLDKKCQWQDWSLVLASMAEKYDE